MYTALYIKTENSILNSTIKIKELIPMAKEYGFSSLAITDQNMFGVMEFYIECKKNQINPIIGLEVKLDFPLLLYAKNKKGYQNLIKINEQPDLNTIKQNSSDLICIISYDEKEKYEIYNSIFESVYVGYQNRKQYENIKEKAIYVNEISFLKKEDYRLLKYLAAIKDNKLIEEVNLNKKECYLRTKDEYQQLDYNIQNNYEISKMCKLDIEKEGDLLPVYNIKEDPYQLLKSLCIQGLKKRFGVTVPKKYQERLKYELDIIQKMGFCNYFLVVQDYVNFAKNRGILVGPGRGSAAGSLVSYVLNITDVDPIEYNLLFERFLNPERITMPDIDIDFEYNRREEVIQYCIQKYGIKKVAGIVTFGTMGAKQAIRDVARCNNIPLHIVDQICKNLKSTTTLKENYQNPVIKNLLYDKKVKETYHIAMSLEGLKRFISNHAAGIVICNKDLDQVVPLYQKDDLYLTAYSMEYLEDLGLLKMDFLALKNLTLITNIIDDIKKEGIDIDFNTIPLNDKKTFELFKTGSTAGIFQFESEGMIQFLKQFEPNTFEDIFACLALYRPGPMKNIEHYIKRKNGHEKINYILDDLEPILKSTYGIMIYQEQIMQVAHVIAGYSLGEADILRRAISKKKEEILKQEQDKFITRGIANGYEKEKVEEIFNLILKFAAYGFNRAHSVAYAFISYKMAYLKTHFKKIYLKNLLDKSIGSVDETKKYLNECRTNDIVILHPDINKSDILYVVEKEGIRYPLGNIRNIGTVIAHQIIDSRDRPFSDIYDFIKRVNINKLALESLILSGTFDCFNYNRKTLIQNLDLIINYGELLKDINEEYALKPIIDEVDEYTKKELSNQEFELFGFYLSNHPVTIYKNKYKGIDLKFIKNYFNKIITTVVLVDKKREIITKNGDTMCFCDLSDEEETVDAVIFPRVYQNVEIDKNNVILITAKVEKRYNDFQLVIESLTVLE